MSNIKRRKHNVEDIIRENGHEYYIINGKSPRTIQRRYRESYKMSLKFGL